VKWAGVLPLDRTGLIDFPGTRSEVGDPKLETVAKPQDIAELLYGC
jgi:hypothetical protein